MKFQLSEAITDNQLAGFRAIALAPILLLADDRACNSGTIFEADAVQASPVASARVVSFAHVPVVVPVEPMCKFPLYVVPAEA